MQRGVLELTKGELEEIVKYSNIDKFNIAMENIRDINMISVNEEILEQILDDVGIVTDNPILNSARKKVSQLLLSFRG